MTPRKTEQLQEKVELAKSWAVPILLGIIAMIASMSMTILQSMHDDMRVLANRIDARFDAHAARIRGVEATVVRLDTALAERSRERPLRFPGAP